MHNIINYKPGINNWTKRRFMFSFQRSRARPDFRGRMVGTGGLAGHWHGIKAVCHHQIGGNLLLPSSFMMSLLAMMIGVLVQWWLLLKWEKRYSLVLRGTHKRRNSPLVCMQLSACLLPFLSDIMRQWWQPRCADDILVVYVPALADVGSPDSRHKPRAHVRHQRHWPFYNA